MKLPSHEIGLKFYFCILEINSVMCPRRDDDYQRTAMQVSRGLDVYWQCSLHVTKAEMRSWFMM